MRQYEFQIIVVCNKFAPISLKNNINVTHSRWKAQKNQDWISKIYSISAPIKYSLELQPALDTFHRWNDYVLSDTEYIFIISSLSSHFWCNIFGLQTICRQLRDYGFLPQTQMYQTWCTWDSMSTQRLIMRWQFY